MSEAVETSRVSLAPRAPGPRARRRSALAVALFDLLLVWQERAEQRRALASMDDYMLRDIGLTRCDIEIEYSKPFWRP